MGRRAVCCLLVLVVLVSAGGCWHVHHDYWGFALSGRYEHWADHQGLLVLWPPLNPIWWFGLVFLAFDCAFAPVTFLHDLAIYLNATHGRLPPPWALDASERWR